MRPEFEPTVHRNSTKRCESLPQVTRWHLTGMCTGHWPFKQKRRRKEEKHKRPATELAILKSKIVERAPASAVDCPTASTPHTRREDEEEGGEGGGQSAAMCSESLNAKAEAPNPQGRHRIQQVNKNDLVAMMTPMIRLRARPAVTPAMGPRAGGRRDSEGRSARHAGQARLAGHQRLRLPARQSTKRPTLGGRCRPSSGKEHKQY